MIRLFTPNDTDDIIRIWYDASIIAHSFLPPEFWAGERETIRNVYLPHSETYVFEHDGKVAGFISLIEDATVGGLFVDPARQRLGIGKALINHAANLKGELTLGVFRHNPGARAFYERMGFVEISRGIEETTGQEEIRLRRPALSS